MNRLLPAVALLAALCAPALASSSDAWAEYEAKVTTACLAASGFKDAKAHTDLIMFGDDVGIDAMVVEGAHPQEHMKGEHGMVLCLYNKTTETAAVSEMQHK
jgi:hypothetical protein